MPNKESEYIYERRANRRNKHDQFNSVFLSQLLFSSLLTIEIRIYQDLYSIQNEYLFKKDIHIFPID